MKLSPRSFVLFKENTFYVMVPTDETLLSQFKGGDERSFSILIERYSAAIYNLAYRFLHDPMEAENVTQETFLRIVSAVDHIRLDSPFKPYLFRVAVNLCRDLARKKHPVLFSDLNSAPRHADDAETIDASEAIEDRSPSPWQHLEREELGARLNAAIAALPPVYRAVITLRFTEEFSYDEIAQTLDLPLNTIRTHLRRAKQQLKVELEKDSNPLPAQGYARLSAEKGANDE